jgi:acetoin utilization deacetylase AcuC-like enzyme
MNVFYNKKQFRKIFRVPIEKIGLLADKWSSIHQIKINNYPLITKESLYEIHNSKFVDDIFNGTIANGFGTTDPMIAEMEIYQVSSFLSASRDALINQVSCSPTAGFHHATYNYAGKFCVFNGLIYAAHVLKKEGRVNKVGILDLDFHYGDGTDDIISKLNIDYINHWGFSKNWVSNSTLFFIELQKGLESMKNCDIILYQAGMDMFKDDPRGGLLTESELRLRDKMVFEWAKKNNIPIVWCLAGGYTEINKLVDLHHMTMEECLKVYLP